MNTREINGSSWKTWYFFAAAIPLAVITVLFPLLAIPILNFLIKRYESLKIVLKWTFFFVTFVLYLATDIVSWTDHGGRATDLIRTVTFVTSSVPLILQSVITLTTDILRKRQRHRLIKTGLHPEYRDIDIRQTYVDLAIFGVPAVCLYIGTFNKAGVELTPYFAYAMFKIWQWLRRNQGQRLGRTTTT